MCFILKNVRKAGEEYFADLVNQKTGEPAMSVKIVYNADDGWAVIETKGDCHSWSIDSVKAKRQTIADWKDDDVIVLGISIQ